MAKDAVFTVKLEPELRDEFVAEAATIDRPAAQLVREFMRDFIKRQRVEREYDEWLRRKIAIGVAQADAGIGRSHEEVEADFAAGRAELLRRASEASA